MMIQKLISHKERTILDALQTINDNGKGIVFVVDRHERLCGVLTDGDLRRALLDGHQLRDPIAPLLTGRFACARQGQNYEQLMAELDPSIRVVPIINEQRQVVDYLEGLKDIHIPVAHPDLTGNEFKYLVHAFLSTWISSRGMYIDKFEKDFSTYCGCAHGVATANGTVALHLALKAIGVGPGDEVIVPDLTFAATINAVLYTGATPVIVDVEPDSWCMDSAAARKAVTRRTKAIMPVHLYGQPCDMKGIMSLARRHGIRVVEDCAEAHGAIFEGKRVGAFGDIGCFSFFANKIITTGEGGMCVTRSKTLMERMRILRDHGMSRKKKYWHETVGFNYRMTNLQAAIGAAQLERIGSILLEREAIEREYRCELAGVPFVRFQRDDLPGRKKVVWLVSVRLQDGGRDRYMERLMKKGIEVRPFFYPLSSMKIYKPYVSSSKFSRRISREGINFPTVSKRNRESMLRDIRRILKGG